MKSIKAVVLIGAGLFVSLNLLQAQVLLSDQSIGEVQPAQPDSIVQVTAEAEGLTQVDPTTLPLFASCWWTVFPNGGPVPMPCPPQDLSVPIYEIADGFYLVDETGGAVSVSIPQIGGMRAMTSSTVASAVERQGNAIADLIEQVQERQFERTMAIAFGMDLPTPGDSGSDGSGTNTFGSNFSIPDYGTNLWIAQTAVTNSYLVGIGTNTFADIQYEIQSRTNLLQTDWQSEGFIIGSETNNWTPLSVAQNGRTNLFIRLRSWASSDGSGLPDWWELLYFGHTGVDPDADPDGDGWSNWEEFKNGTNPNSFDTPPVPQSIVTTINPTNSTVTIKLPPVSGVVTGYTIVRYDYAQTNFAGRSATTYTVGLTNQFVDPNFPPYTEGEFQYVPPSSYDVFADYADGSSAFINNTGPYPDAYVPTVLEMPGVGNATTLLVRHIPPGASSIELERSDLMTDNYTPITGLPSPTLLTPSVYAVYDVSNFASGIFTVPTNMIYTAPHGSYFHVQAIWPDGSKSAIVNAGNPETRFYDGRAQMYQNVSFLLRAANITNSFTYSIEGNLTTQPTSYTYAGLYDVGTGNFSYSGSGEGAAQNWRRPFDDNYRYRNFLYLSSTNLDSSGFLNTGCTVSGQDYFLATDRTFKFSDPTNGGSISALDNFTLAQPYTDYQRLGMSINGSSQFVVPNNIHNLFGLHLASVLIAHNHAGALYLDSVVAGSTWPATNDTYYFYPQYDAPQLQTAGYYFGRVDAIGTAYDQYNAPQNDPMPGNSNFSPSAPQPLIIVGMSGWYTRLAAFSKKTIVNGDISKPVYVGQYFDKAYKVDANGNVTSVQTGVLSPNGDFFPTESGRVAVVTMPDVVTGERGTNIIYVMGLQLDANHDGVMDSSYFDSDEVSPYDGRTSFNFWVNNGYTKPGSGGSLDQDLPVYPGQTGYNSTNVQPNYLYGKIRSERNLENFARLWVRGLPDFPANQGYSVSLGFDPCYGTALNLYAACEVNGGIGYLTDTNVAATQISTGYLNGHAVDFNSMLATMGGYYDAGFQDYTLPLDASGHPWLTNFLFEGVSAGIGNLALTVFQSNNIVAQAFAQVNLDDIKNFYEQATVTNVIQTWPEMVQTTNISRFQVKHTPDTSVFDDKQEAVFVHGWRMTEYDYEKFSDTMYKRLYWQGFKGRFASLRWPTRSSDTDTNNIFGQPGDFLTFNRSEHIAFDSGSGAALYFYNLRQRFPDYTISVTAHSMGNIVMMEALKELAAENQSPLDNYVMMQAAVAAQCYDTTVSNFPAFLVAETNFLPTPNTYANYATGITNAIRGNIANFFNPLDFALATATNDFSGLNVSWEGNESVTKPLVFFGYYYDAPSGVSLVITNQFTALFGVTNLQTRIVNDPLELMPFVARPRSLAVGAKSGVGHEVSSEVNLQSVFGFTAKSYDHSGEFNRNIQDPILQPFYSQLKQKMFPAQ